MIVGNRILQRTRFGHAMNMAPLGTSSSGPNKDSEIISNEKKINDSATGSSKKRRTCYDCATPDNLSSACPNRKGDSLSNNREPDDSAKPGPTIVAEKRKAAMYQMWRLQRRGGHVMNAGLLAFFHRLAQIKELHTLFLTIGSMMITQRLHLLAYLRKIMWLMNRKCCECGISGHLLSVCLN
jgi:hypothetical protein